MSGMNTKEALLACADYLEANGWSQFDPVGQDGKSMCSIAVIDTVGGDALYHAMRDALRDQIGETSVVEWNDAPERTKEEVIFAFRSAAEAVSS